MILRPVTPVSDCGPPITNLPVGLTRKRVRESTSSAGSTAVTDLLDHLAGEPSVICLPVASRMSSVCCDEMTTVSMRCGLPVPYSTVTWDLPSGPRYGSDARWPHRGQPPGEACASGSASA